MPTLAAAVGSTAAERFNQIPTEFWLRMGIAVAVLVTAVIVLRKIAKMNKLLLGGIVLMVVSFVGFNWIYERNEPAWATPAVGWLAGFLPTKGHLHH